MASKEKCPYVHIMLVRMYVRTYGQKDDIWYGGGPPISPHHLEAYIMLH